MTGQAIDVEDPDHKLIMWFFNENRDAEKKGQSSILKTIGLWCEHPSATPTWGHFQSVPPGSLNRFFYP